MIGYKRVNNMRDGTLTYEVGKVYKINNMEEESYKFNFCKNPNNILGHRGITNDFVLLEIEVLGEIRQENECFITDKIKVLRVVPENEYKLVGFGLEIKRDENGNIIWQKNSEGSICEEKYDKNNNRIWGKDFEGDIWEYKYNENNNLIWVRDFEGNIWECKYDEKENRIWERDFWGYIEEWKYDKDNNLIWERDFYGDIWTYTYDKNLVWRENSSGDIEEREYDKNKNLIKCKSKYKNWEIEII